MGALINSFTFFGHHAGLMGDKTRAHLAISFASVGVALAIAIPLGVWLGHLHRGSFLAINTSNVFRALPSLAMISLGIGFLGIGFANVLVALVVLAAPVMLTNAYVAVEQVDRNVVEAARAAGMTAWQVLVRVEPGEDRESGRHRDRGEQANLRGLVRADEIPAGVAGPICRSPCQRVTRSVARSNTPRYGIPAFTSSTRTVPIRS